VYHRAFFAFLQYGYANPEQSYQESYTPLPILNAQRKSARQYFIERSRPFSGSQFGIPASPDWKRSFATEPMRLGIGSGHTHLP